MLVTFRMISCLKAYTGSSFRIFDRRNLSSCNDNNTVEVLFFDREDEVAIEDETDKKEDRRFLLFFLLLPLAVVTDGGDDAWSLFFETSSPKSSSPPACAVRLRFFLLASSRDMLWLRSLSLSLSSSLLFKTDRFRSLLSTSYAFEFPSLLQKILWRTHFELSDEYCRRWWWCFREDRWDDEPMIISRSIFLNF